MPTDEHRYVEMTARLKSLQSFCDFLSNGGVVWIAQTEGSPFLDVTRCQLQKARQEVETLKRRRRQLFGDQADEDDTAIPYRSH
jgi:hypothetical protein